ncbi:MAG TPA: hypothetical protein DCO75_05515 [Fibrobacteres bacterium]|nr:hypothetical protein [Fibrobacterota bacterium]
MKLKNAIVSLLAILLSISINTDGEEQSSFDISYGYAGTFISGKNYFESNAIHDFSCGFIIPQYLILGVSCSIDNTFKINPKKSITGFGPFVGAGLWYSGVQPFILLKYKYFGISKNYQINSNELIYSKINIQNLSIELGSRITLYKHLCIKTAYNLFLYKAGQTFSDQFETLCGIFFYIDYEFVSKK